MVYTKAQIYSMTLSALLLVKEVSEVETDTSNEVRVLNIFWQTAFASTLEDLDLDRLSTPIRLELIEEIKDNPHWNYVYKYPTNCAFLRRLESCVLIDNRSTHISKRVGQYKGHTAIFTNEYDAIAECIPFDIALAALNSMGALALSYKLAMLAAPLLVGKGARTLKDSLKVDYMMAKEAAQDIDKAENFNYESDESRSEFVRARIS
jgi:hypothetical protein